MKLLIIKILHALNIIKEYQGVMTEYELAKEGEEKLFYLENAQELKINQIICLKNPYNKKNYYIKVTHYNSIWWYKGEYYGM